MLDYLSLGSKLEYLLREMEEINGLSGIDIVRIYAAVTIYFNQNFSCAKCTKSYGRSYRDARKGCTEKKKKAILKADGFSFLKCPGNFFDPSYFCLVEIADQFRKNGTLPYAGGVFEQPSKVMEAIHYVKNLLIEEETRQWQKMKSQSRSR